MLAARSASVASSQLTKRAPVVISDIRDITVQVTATATATTAAAATTAGNNDDDKTTTISTESGGTTVSWLALRLQKAAVAPEAIVSCEQALVGKEGFYTESDFALMPADEFTPAYLTRIGISARGLQLRLMTLHEEIQVQSLPESLSAASDTLAELAALKVKFQQQQQLLESSGALDPVYRSTNKTSGTNDIHSGAAQEEEEEEWANDPVYVPPRV